MEISRHGKWDILIGENIAYGYETGRDIVIQLAIDDGVPSRGPRKNLLNGTFKYMGAAIGPHKAYSAMCVIDLAGMVEER